MEINGELKGELGELFIYDLKIGIYHGTSTEIQKCLNESGRYNIIICGLAHKIEPAGCDQGNISKDTSTIALNPGTGTEEPRAWWELLWKAE